MSVQSEAALESGLIATLRSMNYEYVHIDEETNMKANFKNWLNSDVLDLLMLSSRKY